MSRPNTGSIFPSFALAVTSGVNLSSVFCSAGLSSRLSLPQRTPDKLHLTTVVLCQLGFALHFRTFIRLRIQQRSQASSWL